MSHRYLDDDNSAEVTLKMSLGQARAVSMALDFYNRMCLGQLEEITNLIRTDILPVYNANASGEPEFADVDRTEQVDMLMNQVKRTLGYSPNASMGIGHRHMHVSGLRAYEVAKVVDQAVANYVNPTPRFKGVHYDGLIVRYTQDPEPSAEIAASRPAKKAGNNPR